MVTDAAGAGFDLRRLAVPAYGPSLLFGLAEGAILPVVTLTALDLGASVPVAALLVMLTNVASLICNVPASVITHRTGERKAIIAAAALGALSGGICWGATQLWQLVVGVLVFGAASSVFMLARQKYLTEAVPITHRARALSLLGGVMRVGVFAGPFLGAGAISVWGTRSAYMVCALALVLAGLLGASLPDLEVPPEVADAAVSVRDVLRDHARTFATVGLGVVLIMVVRASRQAVIPLWAAHLGLGAQQASIVYGISGGVDMLVFYPAGKVMDVYGRRWVTVPSMLVMGLSLLAIPLTTGAVAFTLVTCILGFGNGIGAGMVMTLGADFSPDIGRAQFLGVWRELSDVGGVGGPALLSGITVVGALGPAIAATGLVGLLAAAVLWKYVPARPGQRV